ncbi:hypothetical protein [Bdellovibrio bacteriovorus]|uniref:hypothetical protein n=1 Tax=Bdellovibrio bacteriovorus TaxID=959 RepID=UPI001C12B9F8|nr:hypothetical protein [Bdellovibrio bacteriovorus]
MNFVDHLRQELLVRSRRNSSYSLRAFAASLELDPSTLSKILRGKRSIGKKFILQVGPKLGLNQQEINSFIKNVKTVTRDPESDPHFNVTESEEIAIHPSQLPEAVEKIRKFRRSMAKFFGETEKGYEVYTLSVTLSPGTKTRS